MKRAEVGGKAEGVPEGRWGKQVSMGPSSNHMGRQGPFMDPHIVQDNVSQLPGCLGWLSNFWRHLSC